MHDVCRRTMVEQLEQVDPGKMSHEQKLAFWINIYNALMMHVIHEYFFLQNFKYLNVFFEGRKVIQRQSGSQMTNTLPWYLIHTLIALVVVDCNPSCIQTKWRDCLHQDYLRELISFNSGEIAYVVTFYSWQAYLAYGIPRNKLKRLSLLQKVLLFLLQAGL